MIFWRGVVADVQQVPGLTERRDVADPRVVRRRREQPVEVSGVDGHLRRVELRDRLDPVEAVVVAEILQVAIRLEPDHRGRAERLQVGELARAPLQHRADGCQWYQWNCRRSIGGVTLGRPG